MNPLTNVKNLNKLNENEIKLGAVGSKTSWHNQYRDSAWCFYGGMPFDLTEGDLICVFSQYGEVVNLNLIRDKKTGKSKGFGFVCYENQKSTDLAVDNFNGTKILGRVIRVDHAGNYRPPKEHEDEHEITKFLRESGCTGQFEASIGTHQQSAVKEEPNMKRSNESEYNRNNKEKSSSSRYRMRSSSPKSSSRKKDRSRSRSRSNERATHKYDRHHQNHNNNSRHHHHFKN